jgi:hypothetical protein
MVVIKNYENKSAGMHHTVYNIARNEIPPQAFRNFVDSTNVYRWRAAKAAVSLMNNWNFTA